MKKFKTFLILLLCAVLISLQCSNPFKSEEKKELVIHLVDDYYPYTGRQIFYWDGRDKKKNHIEPGRYIVLLTIKDWQDQLYIEATPGGKLEANNEQHLEPGFWASFELEPPYPDPFQVQAGVNIPVLIASPARIKIDIYKD